jgi:hypothetical protein
VGTTAKANVCENATGITTSTVVTIGTAEKK